MNPFTVNYGNLAEVIVYAKKMAKNSPQFNQYVVKYPDRTNYNITMQIDRATKEGAEIMWSSVGMN